MKRCTAFLAAVGVLLALTGCARDPLPEGSSTQSFRVGGLDRTYLVTVPDAQLDDAPLVIVMHGGLGSADQARQAYGWDELARREGFVVAYPDGLGRAWNAGDGCCGTSGKKGVDDVGFIERMIDDIDSRAAIDRNRIYATGMSNGAIMAYRLACDTTELAAIAAVAGTILGSCDDPAPLSVLAIHGDADSSVRMDGEPGDGIESIDGLPVAEVNEFWRAVDGCDAVDSMVGEVSTLTAECGEHDVELVIVADAGHQWPGSTQSGAQKLLGGDPPSTALDATETIWRFFEGRSR